MEDRYGHRISYLRVSITDRCNERCTYCMPQELQEWLPREEVLTYEETLRLIRIATELGVSKIRITAGEPLTRRDVLSFFEMLRSVPGTSDLGVSTNVALLPVSTGDVLHAENFLPVGEARGSLEGRYGALIPEPTFRTNGPSTYYKIPGRDQRVGFIGAMSNLHFCESCNKLRLTCDGKLRPCLGSYLEVDIMKPLRAGASDAELKQFFLDVVDRKPEQHDFRNNYQPNRRMIAIGD